MMVIPWLLLLEMGLYASSFVCGIVTASSLTIVQGSFGGLCMLYGTVNHNSSSGSILVQTSSSPSLCYFVSAISVCVAVFCFSISLYWIYTCCLDGGVNRERLWLNVTLVVCGVFLFFLLVTGCVLKVGRDFLCDSVLHAVPNVTRCEQAQSRTWISPYTGTQFYTGLYNAGVSINRQFYTGLYRSGVRINRQFYTGLYRSGVSINRQFYTGLCRSGVSINRQFYTGLYRSGVSINRQLYTGLYRSGVRINRQLYTGLYRSGVSINRVLHWTVQVWGQY
uniref:Transmembrane protein 179Ba n=1 Tax=Oncorhynchus kisutch TaxID=8019 RepID=A0A8C7DD78_ONCKI